MYIYITYSLPLIIGLPKLQVHTIVVKSLSTATNAVEHPHASGHNTYMSMCTIHMHVHCTYVRTYVVQESVLRAFENIPLLEKTDAREVKIYIAWL